MPHRSPCAVPDKDKRRAIRSYSLNQHVPTSLEEYCKTWRSYLTNSEYNKIKNLDQFTSAAFCHGTTQAFDHFYLRHRNKKFRFLKGEFMYHQACLKHGFEWSYLDTGTLYENDAVIISVPFSDSGNMPYNLDKIFERCNQYNIPVLVDLAYLPQSKNIVLDLSQPCIETVTASISKAHDSAQFLRAGIRFQRENKDDGIDVANAVSMVNHHAMAVCVYLLTHFNLDYNWHTYGDLYHAVCKKLVIEPTNCLMFGLSYDNYSEFNRGNAWHRVCISEDIAKLKNENTN